jgi:uncharacterized membrane protein
MLHWITDSPTGFVALLMVVFVLAAVIYALPALMAWSMGSPYRLSITLLDLLLGWTILGWLAALIWAIMTGNGGSFDEDRPPRQEPWMR